MYSENCSKLIYERMAQEGWKGKIVSIAHVDELKREIEAQYQKGLLDENLFNEYLASFDFECQQKFAQAKSLIIVSVPQPQVGVIFCRDDKSYPAIIPPTYNFSTDKHVADLLAESLRNNGYHLKKVRLPEKLLSVRSGLARYGKNNITYVAGMGSFHRTVVFVSDLPCSEDNWGESKSLKSCDGCTACRDACPAGAIVSDRFLVHAERCITFHNERPPEFPHWLDCSWHNCLVGCMYCQSSCPMNTKLLNWIEDGATFDEQETVLLLEGRPQDQMPRETIAKLEKLGMMEYFDVLGRNLKAIIENQ